MMKHNTSKNHRQTRMINRDYYSYTILSFVTYSAWLKLDIRKKNVIFAVHKQSRRISQAIDMTFADETKLCLQTTETV